jgi:prepilin-type N-terminal cleavage/methylation domain-containing protein
MRTMMMQRTKDKRGFTLLEMVTAMTLGLIVLGSAVQLFKMGMDSTTIVVQRAEMQENMRASVELMTKDISLAGAGMPSSGIQLPTGGNATLSMFACDQTRACHVPGNTYPNGNFLTGIIPGFKTGVEANAPIPATAPSGVLNDSITVIYADYNFPLNQYQMTFPVGGDGSFLNVVLPFPAPIPAPPQINVPGGVQVGDLIWLSNSAGNAVGEVTTLTANSLSFANNDPLNINQSGAAKNNIKALNNGTPLTGYRIFAVTYYLTVPINGQLPRLMRQVNGLAPIPVADNIINLQFAYDAYNATTNALDANQVDPIGANDPLNLIQKVNINVMGESMLASAKGAQSMHLATSVSARNMAFRNRYQ